jgi:hypothetical protein
MGGTLWLKSSSGPKSLPPAGVLLPAFETNRVSVCGGTTIERDSHRTALTASGRGLARLKERSELRQEPKRPPLAYALRDQLRIPTFGDNHGP